MKGARSGALVTCLTVGLWLVVVLQAAAFCRWSVAAGELERAVAGRAGAGVETAGADADTEVAFTGLVAREAALRNELWPPRPDGIPRVAPPDGPAAFLELLHFRRAMDALVVSEGVDVSGAGFGFDDYAHSGPEPEDRIFVHRQHAAVEVLLRMLFADKPRRWLGLRREPAPSIGGAEARFGAERSHDYLNAPVPTVAGALAERLCFELRFAGETGVLRAFLNRLAAGPDCIVVRLVEVLPATVATPPVEATDAVRREAEFRVVLEWFQPPA